jgi:glycerophosphoryl diester phosphodiesterase
MSRRSLLSIALCAVLTFAAAASSASAGARSNPWLAERVINFAHQGGEDELPTNTLFAFHEALDRGADMLEIDVGATKDGRLVVLHDNTVDRVTNGTGSITDMTLAQVQRLDGAYWFVPGRGTRHGLGAASYRYRDVRTGGKRPPRGFRATDFRIPALEEVLRAFPRVPMNIEIKGRDGGDDAVYRRTAELLATALRASGRRDVIVASFEQAAIDRFHELAPRVPVAPGIDGTAAFVLSGDSPGPGVAAFQVPITFDFGGQKLTITTPDFVKRAHEAGYAVHVWLSNDREDDATYRRLLRMCVDGIMAAKPSRLEAVLRAQGDDPCGTAVARRALSASDSGAVAVPLERRGQSGERRSGRVRIVRDGATLGSGTFSLDSDADEASARVRLGARGRAAVRRGAVTARAEVLERGRVVSRRSVRVS